MDIKNDTDLEKARSLWQWAKPISRTKGAQYLREKGILIPLPESIRWLPDVFHPPSMKWTSAIIAEVQPSGAVYRLFFHKNGKPLVKNATMTLGVTAGGYVALVTNPGPLIIVDGIKEGLKMAQTFKDLSSTVWAVVSASGINLIELPPKPQHLIIAVNDDKISEDVANSLKVRAKGLGWRVELWDQLQSEI